MTCVMQDPRTFTRCGRPATGSYVHPVVDKVVHHCDDHAPN